MDAATVKTLDDLMRFFPTQAEAARALGFSKQSVSVWARNGQIPRQARDRLAIREALRMMAAGEHEAAHDLLEAVLSD